MSSKLIPQHVVWNGFNLEKALSLRTSSLEQIRTVQGNLLQNHLRRASVIPFYRNLFADKGIEIDSFTSSDHLKLLPFTTRKDLDSTPSLFGIFDEEKIRDIALTSGTTGVPVTVPYTTSDLQRLAYNEAMAYWSAGVRADDRVLLTVTLDRCFIAGLAYYSGVTMLGASAIRSGPGNPQRQWEIIQRLRPTVVVGVPTFLLELARWGRDNQMDVTNSSIRKIITIGEPARKPDCSLTVIGGELRGLWGADIYSSYGATELETAFGECDSGKGGHVHPELMMVEIVDESNNILPDGNPGEIVVTPLGVEGFPLVRFRTGDVARLISEPCSCGWNTKRLGPIEGRLAQRLKVKGTTLYPESIFHALQHVKEVSAAFVEVRSGSAGADEVKVVVAVTDRLDAATIKSCLQAHLRVMVDISIKDRSAVLDVMQKDGGRKPKTFFDFR